MSDDTQAPQSKDALSALWDLNQEHPGAMSLALLLLYHKFTNPLFGHLPEPDSEGQATLEPGKSLENEKAPSPGDSLHLDWLSELPEIPPAPACCTEILGAIDQLTTAVKGIEACCKPAAEAPTADVHKRMDEIEREIRKITERGPKDIINEIRVFQGLFNRFLSKVLGLTALTSNLVALWGAMVTELVQDYLRHKRADPRDLKNWSTERREGLEELTERYPRSDGDSILEPFFAHAWLEWQRALRELLENIESPETSPEAEKLRDESLRVLPDVLEDLQRGQELYQERHDGRDAPFDEQLLDRAKDLLQRTPPLTPESRYEPGEKDDSDLLSQNGGGSGRAAEDDLLTLASYSPDAGRRRPEPDRAQEQFERVLDLMESMIARLREPVRLEVRLLDDRVIARRLDGNRSVDVDLSRGYRMVGYISV